MGRTERYRSGGVLERLNTRLMSSRTYGICSVIRCLESRWLLLLSWLKARLGCWLGCWLRLRQRLNLGLRLCLVRLGPRRLLRLPLFHQFATNDVQELPWI